MRCRSSTERGKRLANDSRVLFSGACSRSRSGELIEPLDQVAERRLSSVIELPGVAKRIERKQRWPARASVQTLSAEATGTRSTRPSAVKRSVKNAIQLRQVFDVCCGVRELRGGQGAAYPVVGLMGLGAAQTERAKLRVGERHAVLDRGERPGNLRVEHARAGAKIRAARRATSRLAVRRVAPTCAAAESFGERRSDRGARWRRPGKSRCPVGDLQQAQLDAGAIRFELGVQKQKCRRRAALGSAGQVAGGGDQFHELLTYRIRAPVQAD